MGLFKKKGCIISVYFRTLQDIGQFRFGSVVQMLGITKHGCLSLDSVSL